MQAKHEAFLGVTRKEIKINLAQRETCFPLVNAVFVNISTLPCQYHTQCKHLGELTCVVTPGG